jgi:2-polyprenyl-6-methoxyphenol hydroxylase-like FAD-dependent oxidoreductase
VTVLVDLGAGPVGHAVALVLAQNPEPPPDKGEEFGKASPVGLVVVLLLGIATVFLIRSMTKRLRRLPASFDTPPEPHGDVEAARDVEAPQDLPAQADHHVDREASPDR